MLGDDRFEGGEVAPVVDLVVVVDGDIGSVAPVRGGKPDVIRGRDAHLDWEADPLVMIIDPGAQSVQHGCQLGARHRVLAFVEPDASWRGEYRVRNIGVLARREGPRRELIDPRY